MKKKIITGIVGMCCVASCIAFGQGSPQGAPADNAGQKHQGAALDYGPVFDRMDSDHDGGLTPEEWSAAGLSQHTFDHLFSKTLDANKDGIVNKEEFTASSPAFEVDTDRDGNVSVAEFVAANNGRAALMSSGGPAGPAPGK